MTPRDAGESPCRPVAEIAVAQPCLPSPLSTSSGRSARFVPQARTRIRKGFPAQGTLFREHSMRHPIQRLIDGSSTWHATCLLRRRGNSGRNRHYIVNSSGAQHGGQRFSSRPRGTRWPMASQGRRPIVGELSIQAEAEKAGSSAEQLPGSRSGCAAVIYREDGSIETRHTYGHDPRRPGVSRFVSVRGSELVFKARYAARSGGLRRKRKYSTDIRTTTQLTHTLHLARSQTSHDVNKSTSVSGSSHAR